MSTLFEEHSTYVRDAARIDAYARALDAVVAAGDAVVDLGAGSGVLGLLAYKAGASRIYVIDEGRMLPVARAMWAASGKSASVVLIQGHSTRVNLPGRAHVVVADQMGPMGIEAGLVECFADARERFLVSGGRCVPSHLEIVLARGMGILVNHGSSFSCKRRPRYSPALLIGQPSPNYRHHQKGLHKLFSLYNNHIYVIIIA